MVGASLVYGIALTGEFGDPDDVDLPDALEEWVNDLQDGEESPHVVSHPTVESDWLVAGFRVASDRMDDPSYVGTLRTQWDERMADLEADRREALLTMGTPKVQVIYGKY
jgi:hypothetical protein